ncbi:MAG TPA: DEAD/DEAH box helicase [Acidimicrobiia bacterium]|jgi:superfamily II DNA/RNA helicase|nr:DEAD/DEAH box helicase [Acidimicrobiia bacterium]
MTTATTFEALGVSPDLVAALSEQAIDEPFPIQTLTIADALAGRDVCGKAKTGSGKTLAFGLPLIERVQPASPRCPTGLVLVPTRELANQVFQVLEPLAARRGHRVAAVYGGVGFEGQLAALRAGVTIVVGTPGRLIDVLERGELRLSAVQVLVLDEADRMLDMGFLPQVQKILYRLESEPQTMLFSATLDGAIRRLVDRYMRDPVFHEVASSEPTVDEMEHRFLLVHQMDKAKVTAAITRGAERTLVFTRTKRGADRLVSDLRREGVKAAPIHGDLRQAIRERALADFGAGKVPVLVATDVAARGLHIDGVDVVLHYDPPEDFKAYLHRSGRTARAGETGVAVTLLLWNQENEVRAVRRPLGITTPIVEVFSNDPRLADLRSLDAAEASVPA